MNRNKAQNVNNAGSRLLSIEFKSTNPIVHQGRRLVLFNRSVVIRLNRVNLNLVWNKPSRLLVAYPNGTEEILPIQDPTGRVLFYILIVGVLMGTLSLLNKKRKTNE